MAKAVTQVANFHRNVRLLRLSKGMTVDDAAKACGYRTRQAYDRIEKDLHNPMLLSACIVANGLGADLSTLLADSAPCPLCRDEPPSGFTCNACRRSGTIYPSVAGLLSGITVAHC